MGTCCGCCGYSNEEHEEPLRIRTNPGPRLQRRCTDAPCCILFLAVLACTAVLVDYLGEKGDLRLIDHGRDHAGDLCGLGSQASRPYAFYPDLETDFKKDPTLRRHYGVCVDSCPKVGQSVPDSGTSARAASWLVLQPSFPVFQRCVPYQQPVDSGTTALCASPACSPPAAGVAPTAPQQVCGLARDGTDKFWLLEPPDASIQDGWRGGGADEALIQARTSMAATAASSGAAAGCAQRVKRQAEVSVLPLDEGLPNLLLASVTSPAYTFGNAVADNLGLVLGLGLGGALVLSVAIMLMFPLCAPPVLILLLLVVFFTLVAADYVLFVQAGIATGRTGERFTQFLASLDINVPPGAESLLTQAGDESSGQLCAIGGCCLAVAIALLACLLLSMARQFKILIALLKEAGNMIRVVPSLLALPIFLLASLAVFFGLFLVAFLGLATASQDEVQDTFSFLGLQADQLEKAFAFFLFVMFIWLYFFHIALYHSTIALTVSSLYFRGDLREHHLCPNLGGCLGSAVAVSLLQIFRYHLGSLAFGSLAMTLCTVPRLVLEYMERHTKEATEQNPLAKSIRCITKCCLNWLYCCLRFVTEYAYIYVAVIGEAFAPAACKSFALFAKYPTQVALNKLTSIALGFLVSLGVPLILAGGAFLVLRESWVTYECCALTIVALSFLISRLAVGVYDVIVTSLFVCAMRDEEYCGGQHMSLSLRRAVGLTSREGVECA